MLYFICQINMKDFNLKNFNLKNFYLKNSNKKLKKFIEKFDFIEFIE